MANPESPQISPGTFEGPSSPSATSKMPLPPSSPRLPSPPPPTEIQIGPKSPSLGPDQSIIDANANRRIHPGTKAADMAAGPPLIPLNELDSAFQLQEHLKALHYHLTLSPSPEKGSIPITRNTAVTIASPPEGLDRTLWLYELCRFLINKCNDLICGFLFDNPPCSALTCPEMRASEWQFLCAVHEAPKSCCAIDYCCHTLDWATNIVTSQKIFPSRLSLLGGEGENDRGAGLKHLVNIFRRLHRIFAHAWFQHKGVFWSVEGDTGLYVLFKTVCDAYELLPAENYKLPPEAEGLEPLSEEKEKQNGNGKAANAVPTILKSGKEGNAGGVVEEEFMPVERTNTRRHIRRTPSLGSAVSTVMEADEEDPDVTRKLDELSITDEEGEGEAEVPVIVESYSQEEPQPEQPQIGGQPMEREPSMPVPVHEEQESQHPIQQEIQQQQQQQQQEEETTISSASSWDGEGFETPEGSVVAAEPVETVVEDAIPKHLETGGEDLEKMQEEVGGKIQVIEEQTPMEVKTDEKEGDEKKESEQLVDVEEKGTGEQLVDV